jgi:rfaE bifunctional protein kinase chain/domain
MSSAGSFSTLRTTVDRFPDRRILVVGDLVADHYLYGQTDRVSREAPVLIVRYESSEVKLGGGANAAANARALGAKVTALGVLGPDEMGEALEKQFAEAGIELAAVRASGLQTETKTRILAGGLNTTRQQMLRVDRGNRPPLPPAIAHELAERVREAASRADAVVVSDYGAGVVGNEVREVLRRFAAEGLPVCVDSRYGLRDFVGATVCKPNEPELESLVGRVIRSDEALREAGESVRRMLECRTLLVTRGRSGMAVFQDGRSELLPVHGHKDAVDVTGAGDTVIAAFTLALSVMPDPIVAAQLANVAGALVVQKAGTATVSRDELCAELERAR